MRNLKYLLSILLIASLVSCNSPISSNTSESKNPSNNDSGLPSSTTPITPTSTTTDSSTPQSSETDDKEEDSVLSVSKVEYLRYEDVVVTAKGDGKAWVGLYRNIDVIGEDESIYWYYVQDASHTSGKSYSIQHYGSFNPSRSTYKELPPSNYRVVYFSHDYEIVKEIPIKIRSAKLPKPNAPTSVSYTLSNPGSGLASGTMEVSFSSDSYATDIVMYWADGNGILDDYTALAKEKVEGEVTSITLPERMTIPSTATALWIYGSNNVALSENPYVISIDSKNTLKQTKTPLASYTIVSDVHIATENTHLASSDAKTLHDEHFLSMLDDAKSFDEDAIIINGDIANSGSENEWKHTMELLSSKQSLPNVYYSIGNHDLYGGTYDNESALFKKYTGLNSIYYSADISGYHHIFLGSESSSYSTVDAWLSQDQLKWFEDKLNSYPSDEPVFVYLHQSLYNTVAGSLPSQGWNGITQDSEVRRILSNHKNAIFFNGHSHWDMNSKSNMYPKDENLGNIFNSASVGYLWNDYYIWTGEYERGSQGYHVEIYDETMIVKGRDYESHKWIPSACYMIEI